MEYQKELLSRKDTIYLLELINESLFCTQAVKFEEIINKLNYILPFEFTVCALAKTNGGSKVESYETLNISYPEEWLSIYGKKGYYRIDPVVRENFAHYAIQYWADTYKKSVPSKEVISKADDFNLSSGYTHGMRNFTGDEGSLFSFAGKSLEHHPRTEIILKYFVPHLHNAFIRVLGQNKKNRNTRLSPREKETLKWIKYGKSNWDISVILAISENTVKYHVKNILQKLDSVSRVQAVAVAIEQRLIDID